MLNEFVILPMGVKELTDLLEALYPIDAGYSSRCSLYQNGLKNKIITKNEFEAAKCYYGDLWNYVGD